MQALAQQTGNWYRTHRCPLLPPQLPTGWRYNLTAERLALFFRSPFSVSQIFPNIQRNLRGVWNTPAQSPLRPKLSELISSYLSLAGELFGNIPCSWSSSYNVCILCIILRIFVKMSVFDGRAAQRIVLPNMSQDRASSSHLRTL